MIIRQWFADGGIGFIIALIVLLLAIVALFGGIAITPHFVMVEVAGCALSRLI
jgi:hypothetical protein